MPYAAIERPSIALGLLKASLERAGIDCRTIYANLSFAERIGLDKYTTIESADQEMLAGEWTFSEAAFPEFTPDRGEYFHLLGELYSDHTGMLEDVRGLAGPFIDAVARDVLDSEPRIVGCSSTFQQNCASLALLRRIRVLAPDVITIMGGANCEGSMGAVARQCFPWVDFVISGEADGLLPDLCRRLLEEGREIAPERLPYGVISGEANRRLNVAGNGSNPFPRATVADLDALPTPDYDEYFEALEESPLAAYVSPGLIVETSRGCWWGQKHHCTFCGLNGEGMNYRKKSTERVVEEFAALSARYRLRNFEVVDNILDMGHLQTVLPEFIDTVPPYRIFYETKANLRREHMEILADSGVCWIQPGLESMHQKVLQLLDKGNSAMMNLQLLKWSRELGIRVSWNFLCGIPGERDTWYEEMLTWLPLIVHLEPPQGLVRIRIDRFSVYQERPEAFGLDLAAHRVYSYIYPVPPEKIDQFVYFFENRRDQWRQATCMSTQDERLDSNAQRDLRRLIFEWKNHFWFPLPPLLCMTADDECVRVIDTRPCAVARSHKLQGTLRLVYLACDRAMGPAEITRTLQAEGNAVTLDEVDAAIAELVAKKLALALEGKLLALAVPGSIPKLPVSPQFPGGYRQLTPLAA